MNDFTLIRERNISTNMSDIAFAAIQADMTVSDILENSRKIELGAKRCIDEFLKIPTKNSLVLVTSELAICGYPAADLLLNDQFISDCTMQVERIAQSVTEYFFRNRKNQENIYFLIGHPMFHKNYASKNTKYSYGVESLPGTKRLTNSASLFTLNGLQQIFHKTLLPTYNVFDEARYFEPCEDPSQNIFYVNGLPIGVTICEDIWNEGVVNIEKIYASQPIDELKKNGAKFVVNLSASPYFVNKRARRREMIEAICEKYSIGLLYVNQFGGNDSLVFDGGSQFSFGSSKHFTVKFPHSKEKSGVMGLVTVNTNGDICGVAVNSNKNEEWERTEKSYIFCHGGEKIAVPQKWIGTEELEIAQMVITGISHYMRKTANLTKAFIGMSGGIDSALVSCLATCALGKENVYGITMPTKFNSDGTISDARSQASMLEINFREIPIESMRNSFIDVFKEGKDDLNHNLTSENIQARIRGMILMGFSNEYPGSIVLSTGNKSEMAMGYFTLFGDSAGGLAPISDIYKTQVFKISEMFVDLGMMPETLLTRAPSAELSPDQKDSDTLPAYDILDAYLKVIIDNDGNINEHREWFSADNSRLRELSLKVARNEFKRKSCAPTIAVNARPWSVGWHRTSVSNYEQMRLEDPALPYRSLIRMN
jgi:NAD+ synthase/NAD+ synthase (glutamine-hydrolysing)